MSANYFFYFAGFGVFLPFITPYLMELGYEKKTIGLIYTSFSVISILSPMIAGRFSDRKWGAWKTHHFLIVGLVLSLAILAGVLPSKGIWFLVGLWVFGFFRGAIPSIQDTLAMAIANENAQTFSRMRLLGSLGFVFGVIVAGQIFSQESYRLFWWILLGFSLPLLVITRFIPQIETSSSEPKHTSFWKELNLSWWFWLSAMILHWLGFAPFHYGFTFYLKEQGISAQFHGWVWALGVIAEIIMFYGVGQFYRRWSYRQLLFVAFVSNMFRWILLGFSPPDWLIWLSQLSHALGFALFYTSALQGISKYHGGRFRASYQALFATSIALVSNIGGITLSGWLHEYMSMAHVFLCFVPFQAVAIVLLIKYPLMTFEERQSGLERGNS